MLTLLTLIQIASASTPSTNTFYLSSGETLSHYSSWSGLSVDDIVQENDLDSSGVYAIGTPIRLPISSDGISAVASARSTYLEHRFEDWSMEGNVYIYEYTVQSGDSAWSIARDHDIDLWHLEAANPGVDLETLHPEQPLQVPVKEEYGC